MADFDQLKDFIKEVKKAKLEIKYKKTIEPMNETPDIDWSLNYNNHPLFDKKNYGINSLKESISSYLEKKNEELDDLFVDIETNIPHIDKSKLDATLQVNQELLLDLNEFLQNKKDKTNKFYSENILNNDSIDERYIPQDKFNDQVNRIFTFEFEGIKKLHEFFEQKIKNTYYVKTNKIKWNGKQAEFNFLMSRLVIGEFIDLPMKHNEEIVAEFARMCLKCFEIPDVKEFSFIRDMQNAMNGKPTLSLQNQKMFIINKKNKKPKIVSY